MIRQLSMVPVVIFMVLLNLAPFNGAAAAPLDSLIVRVDPAMEEYRAAVRANSNDYVARNKLGNCYLRAGSIDAAIKEYKKVTKLNDRYASAWNNLGAAYHAKGKFKKAVKYYRKAVALQPNMVPAYKNLGAALIAISRIEEGIDAYRHALNLDPAVLESPPDFLVTTRGEAAIVQYYYLAKLCAVNGRIDSAIEYLNKAKAAGFANFKKVTIDPDFKDIITDARFVEMAQSNMN